jgi:hypothetical protein
MSLLRRDISLVQNLLKSYGVELDDNTKKLIKIFDLSTMVISDGARVCRMLETIGMSATTALGAVGLLIETLVAAKEAADWLAQYAGPRGAWQARRPAHGIWDILVGSRTTGDSTITKSYPGERPSKETA